MCKLFHWGWTGGERITWSGIWITSSALNAQLEYLSSLHKVYFYSGLMNLIWQVLSLPGFLTHKVSDLLDTWLMRFWLLLCPLKSCWRCCWSRIYEESVGFGFEGADSLTQLASLTIVFSLFELDHYFLHSFQFLVFSNSQLFIF